MEDGHTSMDHVLHIYSNPMALSQRTMGVDANPMDHFIERYTRPMAL